MPFFNLRDDKGCRGGGGEAGNLTYTAIPFGFLGLLWSDLPEKAWRKPLTHLRLPGIKIGNGPTQCF